MDVMALQCRGNVGVLATKSKVGREAEVQRGRAVLKVTKRSLTRCNAICGGADCVRPSSEDFSDSANLLCGSAKSGGRDWRVCSSRTGSGQRGENGGRSATRLNATVEKANDVGSTQEKTIQIFGSSETSCDESSSFLALESILENDGGKSKEDYKLRAHIFSESDLFFSALKDRNSRIAN